MKTFLKIALNTFLFLVFLYMALVALGAVIAILSWFYALSWGWHVLGGVCAIIAFVIVAYPGHRW